MADLLSRAERALNGARLPTEALIALIREVNPTGLELKPALQQRRYALKSRLQSLLLRRHFDELELQPADDPAVVGLLHRPSRADACHAVIDELDDDVRARVRFHLDTAAPPASPTSPSSSPTDTRPTAAGLLSSGRRALADYDFEAARDAFTRALHLRIPGAGEHLLDLLVDHLAAYDDALALESELTPLDARLRARLALAAARAQRPDDCLRLAAGLDDPSLAPAFVELARPALLRGALDDAARLLEQARRLAPNLPEIVALSDELAGARARAREPLERELERLLAAGSPDAAAHARDLLERWPDSACARRALRELDQRSRRSRAEQLNADADAAASRGEDERALELYRQAAEHGASGLDARISAARGRLDSARARERCARAAALLCRAFDADACAAFLDLDRSQRDEVRSSVPEYGVALDWLEQLARDTHRRELPALAEAIRALKAAGGDPKAGAASREAVLRHAATLSKLDAGRSVLEALRTEERSRVEAADALRLTAARAALEAGRWSEVISGLAGLEAGSELVARAQREVEAERRRRDFAAAVAARDALSALAVLRAEERAASAPPLEWRRDLQPLLRETFAHESAELAHAPELNEPRLDAAAGAWVDLAHGRWYQATVHGRHLFVRRCELASGRVLSVCALRTPVAMQHVELVVDGGLVALTGLSGTLLVLDAVSWDIVDWREPAHFAPGEVVEAVLAVPRSRYLWLSARARRAVEERVRVVDLERDRVHREIPQAGTLQLLPGPGGPRIVINGFDRSTRIFSLAGHLEASLPREVFEPSVAPNGQGQACLEHTDDDDAPLRVWLCEPGAAAVRCDEIDDSDSTTRRAYGTSLVHRRWYVLFADRSGAPRLLCYAQADHRLVRQWSVHAPHDAMLISDASSERVWLLAGGETCPCCVELDAAVPRLAAPGPAPKRLPGVTVEGLWCWPSESLAGTHAAEEISRELSADRRRQLVSRAVSEAGDAWEAADIVVALRRWRRTEDAEVAAELVESRYPGHGAAALCRAELHLQRGELERFEGSLRSARTGSEGFTARQRAHLLHLEGIACCAQERPDEALEKFEEAAGIEECQCDVDGWVSFLRASLGREGAGQREQELVTAVRQADAASAKGDADEALRLLDRRVIWSALEDQLAARLALAAAGARRLAPLRRRLILAAAFERLNAEDRRQLPLGKEALPPESLAAALTLARLAVDT